jgi:hypothetical protein
MSRESINKQLRIWEDKKWVRLERNAVVILATINSPPLPKTVPTALDWRSVRLPGQQLCSINQTSHVAVAIQPWPRRASTAPSFSAATTAAVDRITRSGLAPALSLFWIAPTVRAQNRDRHRSGRVLAIASTGRV